MKELTERYGETGAQALVEHKKSDEKLAEKEIRFHPEAPGVEAGYFIYLFRIS